MTACSSRVVRPSSESCRLPTSATLACRVQHRRPLSSMLRLLLRQHLSSDSAGGSSRCSSRPRRPPPPPARDGGSSTSSRAHVASSATSTGTRPADLLAPAAGAALLLLVAAEQPAAAAKVCLDVPDWLAELNPAYALLHNPVVAVGAAALALLLAPRLIKGAITYLALPLMVALLAWLAVSHPQQTAGAIELVLEFAKEHPAASSIGVLAAAGIFLGPDLLAGAAVAGGLVLLCVQAGLLQLPQAPRLPPLLPGQQAVEQQLGRAGKALQQRALQAVYDVDDDDEGDDDGRNASRRKERRQRQQQQQQAAPPVAAAADALGGLGRSAGEAAQGLFERARDALPRPEAVQEGLQGASKGLGAAAQRLGARALDAVQDAAQPAAQQRRPPLVQQTQQAAADERTARDVDAILINS